MCGGHGGSLEKNITVFLLKVVEKWLDFLKTGTQHQYYDTHIIHLYFKKNDSKLYWVLPVWDFTFLEYTSVADFRKVHDFIDIYWVRLIILHVAIRAEYDS